ncbi:hypothetical protein E5288_WYG004868 [Bos mutus]|uniref:Uncharacterized protein n=1 Tax=Bos mutus TaxID=72004 RepID=A0A6B0R2D2_9CETA|nr:hypothetical protein [Bos mutus]
MSPKNALMVGNIHLQVQRKASAFLPSAQLATLTAPGARAEAPALSPSTINHVLPEQRLADGIAQAQAPNAASASAPLAQVVQGEEDVVLDVTLNDIVVYTGGETNKDKKDDQGYSVGSDLGLTECLDNPQLPFCTLLSVTVNYLLTSETVGQFSYMFKLHGETCNGEWKGQELKQEPLSRDGPQIMEMAEPAS